MSFTKSRFIEIRSRFSASHHWPEAPAEVGFLVHPHRHEFHVRARISVYGDDRELEFFLVKGFINGKLAEWEGKFLGKMSCEMMAEAIAKQITLQYGLRTLEVEVSEDGENGALVVYK